ncbi:MAG: acyl-CoA thioesterase [Lautropia sp.]|nr:acyl-CoA thioesterase [Lautropia sp.]
MSDQHTPHTTPSAPGQPTRLPEGRLPTLSLVPMPKDANPGGSVFGGWIMSQVDIAGAVEANRRARGRVTTVAVSAMTFHEPVRIGERVLFYAEVIKTGRTSITTKVEVFVERDIYNPVTIKVSEATVTYVAIDANRRPRPVDDAPH